MAHPSNRTSHISPIQWEAIEHALARGEQQSFIAHRYGLKIATLQRRIQRNDWVTPQRLERRIDLLVSMQMPDGSIPYSPDSPCDSAAAAALKAQKYAVTAMTQAERGVMEERLVTGQLHAYAESPEGRVSPPSQTKSSKSTGKSKATEHTSQEGEESESHKGHKGDGEKGKGTLSLENSAAGALATTESLTPGEMRIATLAGRTLNDAIRRKSTLPLRNVNDLKTLLSIVRTLAGKDGESSGKPSVAINLSILNGQVQPEKRAKGREIEADSTA